jgi:hypothetical protein
MNAMMDQYLDNSILDPQAPKVTTEVDVNLIKTKEGWKISQYNNDDLFNQLLETLQKLLTNKG